MDRNLVLLLSSGHTVKIALRPDDLTGNGGPTGDEVRELLTGMPSVVVGAFPGWIFAFVEDMEKATVDDEPNDFQRIDAYSPGEAL